MGFEVRLVVQPFSRATMVSAFLGSRPSLRGRVIGIVESVIRAQSKSTWPSARSMLTEAPTVRPLTTNVLEQT
jgi:hypothetical protein